MKKGQRTIRNSLCLILVVGLLFCPLQRICAMDKIGESSIVELAEVYLESALDNREMVGIPDVSTEEIYICQRISPYILEGDNVVINENVGYYFLKTDNDLFACLTVFFEDGEIISASLSTQMVDVVENANVENDAFALISNKEVWYVKTNDTIILEQVVNETQNIKEYNVINNFEIELSKIVTEQNIWLSQTYDVQSRSSRVLSVPYVSQGNYNICWAAAAISLGRFYKYSGQYNFDPYELACEMKGSPTSGTMDDARQILSEKFDLSTTYVNGQMSKTAIINNINQGRPILTGFHPNSGMGHMVVVCGFNDGGDGKYMTYYLRDPNYENMTVAGADRHGTVVIDYIGNQFYYWDESAYH